MARLVVIGSGDFARDVVAWLQHDGKFRGSDEIVMLDNDESALAFHPQLHLHVAGTMRGYGPVSSDRLLMGIASPAIKRELGLWADDKRMEFSTFIHRSAIIAPDAQVGQGAIICPNVIVSTSVVLGQLVTVNLATTIG